jgi:hypothetical protein
MVSDFASLNNWSRAHISFLRKKNWLKKKELTFYVYRQTNITSGGARGCQRLPSTVIDGNIQIDSVISSPAFECDYPWNKEVCKRNLYVQTFQGIIGARIPQIQPYQMNKTAIKTLTSSWWVFSMPSSSKPRWFGSKVNGCLATDKFSVSRQPCTYDHNQHSLAMYHHWKHMHFQSNTHLPRVVDLHRDPKKGAINAVIIEEAAMEDPIPRTTRL